MIIKTDFEIRDKRAEEKFVGLEAVTSAARVANVVIFGKARKVRGGENERPKDVLTQPLVGPLYKVKSSRPIALKRMVSLQPLN
jgi:hypothetical protein